MFTEEKWIKFHSGKTNGKFLKDLNDSDFIETINTEKILVVRNISSFSQLKFILILWIVTK